MNIFILNTGRCGSTTFIKACKHMINYTSAHESLISVIGPERLNYPDNHIEADNRLSWQLGRLDSKYGNSAFYVHLKRARKDTAVSFSKRIDFGILKAYEEGVLMHEKHIHSPLEIANDYIESVEANIQLFLKDKSRKMEIQLENVKPEFTTFWSQINAQGDLQSALEEWKTSYNAS